MELFGELVLLLNSREAVSDTRDRLAFYFKARGTDVSATAPAAVTGTSRIYIGEDLG